MKRKIFELFIVFFVFLSCGNKSEVLDYSKFKIATKKISAPEDVIFGMVTDDNFIVCSQPRGRCMSKYSFDDDKTDILFKTNATISNFYCTTSDSILIKDYYSDLVFYQLSLDNNIIQAVDTLILSDTNYWYYTLFDNPLVVGNFICTSVINKNANLSTDYDYTEYLNEPAFVLWKKDSNRLVKHMAFGSRPSDHPLDNYYDDSRIYLEFNSSDSLLICSTALSNMIKVYDLNGREIGEYYMGNDMFKVAPFGLQQSQNATEYIKYSESNTIYANLCYDKYRNMYYRIMTIPTHTSPDSMTKSNLQSWLLIVADSTFSIKYNVLFENTTYIPKLYITTKGVYLIDASSIKNRRYEIFDLFVFD